MTYDPRSGQPGPPPPGYGPPPGYAQQPPPPYHGQPQQPYYGQQPPQKKRRGCLIPALIVGAVLIGLFAIAAAVGTSNDEDTSNDADTGSGDSDSTSVEGQDVYAVGDTAHTGVFDVTVHQVVNPWQSSNQFETPQAGHHYVAVEVSLTATEGDQQLNTWSSLLGAEVSDSAGRPWQVALAGTDLPPLDGDVGLGQTRRGWVVFEVADDATGLQLRLKGNVTATGSLFALDAAP